MFCFAGVCLSTGGVSQHALGRGGVCIPAYTGQGILRDTVNMRAVRVLLEYILVDIRSMFCLADVSEEVWSATGQGFSLLFGRKSDSVTSLTEKLRNNSCQQRQVQHKFTIFGVKEMG